MPTAIKAVGNIFLYSLYTIIISLLIGFIAPYVGYVIDYDAGAQGLQKADIIQIFLAVGVFLITFFFKDFFYISLKN